MWEISEAFESDWGWKIALPRNVACHGESDLTAVSKELENATRPRATYIKSALDMFREREFRGGGFDAEEIG